MYILFYFTVFNMTLLMLILSNCSCHFLYYLFTSLSRAQQAAKINAKKWQKVHIG